MHQILVVLRVNLCQGQLHELTVNYGADYWMEYYHLLSATTLVFPQLGIYLLSPPS